MFVEIGYLLIPMQAANSTMNFDETSPPNCGRKSPQMGLERDDSRLRECTRELARWHPKTRSFFSQFFFSVGENGLNGPVPCNASRWNLQERLYIESHLGESQFPRRN